MSYAGVYYSLQEIFPQIDQRILKAVASKYFSDIDSAVEYVLSDVLPAVTDVSTTQYTAQNVATAANSRDWLSTLSSEQNFMNYEACAPESSHARNVDIAYNNVNNDAGVVYNMEYKSSAERRNKMTVDINPAFSNTERNFDLMGLYGSTAASTSTSRGPLIYDDPKIVLAHENEDFNDISSTEDNHNLSNSRMVSDLSKSGDNHHASELFTSSVSVLENSVPAENNLGASSLSKSTDNNRTVESSTSIFIPEDSLSAGNFLDDSTCAHKDIASGACFKLESVSDLLKSDDNFNLSALCGLPQPLSAPPATVELDSYTAGFDQLLSLDEQSAEGAASLPELWSNSLASNVQAENVAEMDALQDSISDMIRSKDTLAGAYELTLNKMSELEKHEENVRLLKESAICQEKDFVAMVEDFEEQVKTLKESNEQRMKELVDDKAILESGALHIQARLSNLSEQHNEASSAIEEMDCLLTGKLTAVLAEKAKLEDEIAAKQQLTRRLLEEHKAALECMTTESDRLQKEVKESNMLRGMIVEHGRMVDVLQEDIASIYKMAMALRGRVEMHIKEDNLGPRATAELENAGTGSELPVQRLAAVAADNAVASDDEEWEVLNDVAQA